ncbi:hypothetical protein KC355_g13999 [Hortaea werneckii]|nr:hypothetical protein KC355_g13999 [Hortaea werneckii]
MERSAADATGTAADFGRHAAGAIRSLSNLLLQPPSDGGYQKVTLHLPLIGNIHVTRKQAANTASQPGERVSSGYTQQYPQPAGQLGLSNSVVNDPTSDAAQGFSMGDPQQDMLSYSMEIPDSFYPTLNGDIFNTLGWDEKRQSTVRTRYSPQHVQRACVTVAPLQTTRPSYGPSRQIQASKQSVCQFSVSACLYKKGGKAAREEKQAAAKDSGKDAGGDDPFDFSTLEADIAAITERLKNDLSKLRAGGRFNPEVLEALRVQPDKSSKETVKLNDVAQVIPKGRSIQILVGEKDHVKPVTSAITSSNLSLTPHPDPTGANPLMLVINIPPPTAESRKAAVQEAAKAGEKASTSARDARGKQQKKLRGMQLNKSVRPDDLKKAGTQMEKVVEKGTAELKRVVDNAKKVLESG